MDAFVEIGRDPSSKDQIQSKCGEWAGCPGTGRRNLFRETKFSGANGERQNAFYSSVENEHY